MTPDDFKNWRQSMGMTQSETAEALGMTRSNIANYEAGKRRDNGKELTIPKVVALACLAIQHGLKKG